MSGDENNHCPDPAGSRLVEVKNFDHPIHYGWGIYLDGEYVRLRQELEWIAKCLGVKYRPFAPSAQISDTIAQHVLERHGRSVFICRTVPPPFFLERSNN
jgi:hypothetical protein